MPVIAFTNQKGGVGKTTSAINVATELAKAGHPTLLIDLDPQGNASSGLGYDHSQPQPGSYDLLIGRKSLGSVAQKTLVPGLDMVPASRELSGAEVELSTAEGRYVRLARSVGQHHYEYVLIDCPPALGFLSLNALVAARYVAVPVQCEYYALEGLSGLFEVLRKVRKSLNPELDLLGIIITMYDRRLKLSSHVIAEVQKHFPDRTFTAIIPRNVRLAEAPSFGEPIGVFDRWSKGAKSYKQLAEEVHEQVQARAWQRA